MTSTTATAGGAAQHRAAGLLGSASRQGAGAGAAAGGDTIVTYEERFSEHFIPVTRAALIDRLANESLWAAGTGAEVERFFRYLSYWREQRHSIELMRLLDAYEPFSPDSDLYITRTYSAAERAELQRSVVERVRELLSSANYTEVPREKVPEKFLTAEETHYGLDLYVDLDVFEELLVFYRGEAVTKTERRNPRRFFRKQEFDVPIYRRVFVLFKIRPLESHIEHVRRTQKLTREEAEARVRRSRRRIPETLRAELAREPERADNIHLKIFKNMPQSDLEMIFPNTRVKFRKLDKLWLGASGGGAVVAGIWGIASQPGFDPANLVKAIGPIAGLGVVFFRQAMNVWNQQQRYLQTMAQNRYFHAMADNRGAMSKLADRASEEDFKEEILLYSILAKEPAHRDDLKAIDRAIESYVKRTFDVTIDFDVSDAYRRLKEDGIISELPDGTIRTLPPKAAADHVDEMWDKVLDLLPDTAPSVGREIVRPLNGSAGGAAA